MARIASLARSNKNGRQTPINAVLEAFPLRVHCTERNGNGNFFLMCTVFIGTHSDYMCLILLCMILLFQFSCTADDYSDISSVPPLHSPMPPLDNSDVSPAKTVESQSLESLGVEMELQFLSDRVAVLEANYDRVLRNQEEIISRLATLENRFVRQNMGTPHSTSYRGLDELSETESSFNQSPMYIPPPPLHPPPRLSLDEHESAENQTPSREFRAKRRKPVHQLPSHPPQLRSSQPIPLPPHASTSSAADSIKS